MAPNDIDENHDVIDEYDLDPEMVRRLIEKVNDKREDARTVANELMDVVDVDEHHALDLVQDWREPDWPIEYEKRLDINDVDVCDTFQWNYRGYDASSLAHVLPGSVYARWRIDKSDTSGYGSYKLDNVFDVELVEIAGVDVSGETE